MLLGPFQKFWLHNVSAEKLRHFNNTGLKTENLFMRHVTIGLYRSLCARTKWQYIVTLSKAA